MFVLCPHCQFLVATDPVSGQPPARCPRCAEPMLADDASAALPPADDADTASDAAVDAGAREPSEPEVDPVAEPLVEPRVEPATEPATPPLGTPTPTPPPQDDAATEVAATEGVEDDDTTSPGHASDASALDDEIVDEPAHDEQVSDQLARDATAPESTDTLIEAMLGPASIEIEAAVDDPPTNPEDPVTDLSTEVPAEAAPGAAPDDEPEALVPAVLPAVDPTPEAEAEAAGPADAPAAPVTPRRPAKSAPSFVRRPAAVSGVTPRRAGLKAAAIAGLTLVLALQLVLADRAQLAANARWRPAMSMLCGVLHCTLPPWREPAAFTLLQRDVRPHPAIHGALQVTATFRNDARWAQPLPGVLLTLSDIDGHIVAARAFTPGDYLDGAGRKLDDAGREAATKTQTTLASGHSKTITMDVVEPTPRIVAFTFDFR